MCPEKFSVIIKRKAFQNSVWYKSNAGEKIIPVFSRRERERNIVPVPKESILRKYSSGSYPEFVSA